MRRRFCHSIGNGRVRLAIVLLAAAGSLIAGSAATADDKITAVLKAQEVDFVYRSTVNLFACDELRNHVAVILRAMGARDDVRVRVNDCELVLIPEDTSATWDRSLPGNPGNPVNPADRFRDPSDERRQFSTVHVWLMFPVEATPEIMAEIDKDKSRRDLISRVTGNPPPRSTTRSCSRPSARK